VALTSLNDYINAIKQAITLNKNQAATTVAVNWHSLFDRTGNPGAGSLAIGNTANGLVPVSGNTGFPTLNAFSGANRGYLSVVDFGSSVACRLRLFDRLFHVGSVALNALATTTLSAQPSFASRVSFAGGAADYKGLTIWLECNATVSATATVVQVQYTNQDGTAGRLTSTVNMSGFITGRMIQLALQTGDTGVQKIEAIIVSGTVATTGTVNVLILRSLWTARVRAANDGDVHGLDRTGLPEVFATSALFLACSADSTSSGVPELEFEIVNV
jgi:hypothetical protein